LKHRKDIQTVQRIMLAPDLPGIGEYLN